MMTVEVESYDIRTQDMVCEEVYATTQGNALIVWGQNCCSDTSIIPNLTPLLHHVVISHCNKNE